MIVPENMKAAVLVAPGQFEFRDVPVPKLGHDDVLVRVTQVGICGTDIHMFHGRYAADALPIIPGHEFCGVVAAVGEGVKNVKIGTRVVSDINIGCGACYWCRRNEVLNCCEVTQIGIRRDGAFADFVAVPSRLVIPAPDDVPVETLALTEPVGCVVRAAKKAQVGIGDSVVVLGAGPIGNLHVQMMRLVGAAPIIVFDLSEARCQAALAVGADIAVTDPAGLKDVVMRATDAIGADLVIESVGLVKLYETAFDLIRKGGHVAFFGITGPQDKLDVPILQTVLQENSLKGSVAAMGEDMHQALRLLMYGRFDVTPFTGAVYPLSDIQQAFDSLPSRPNDLKTQLRVS
ncbi:zinc-dependent alcohol dehydrogenase [Rhizobium anhuiense]|uniref:zinc-dependent alcohol dehydrogenase n=1 Tax=Rhizobium anhuiense TaxID=1184720 RepID=UPI0020CFA191|nr:alcohol dehydrogenase catalytic domain-containing protein [Rhizobium anhuiense]UTS88743.1 alcohol dehydrogenase catalytic domain-containing protein [Rhizobium anhuiense bv. trifolii]